MFFNKTVNLNLDRKEPLSLIIHEFKPKVLIMIQQLNSTLEPINLNLSPYFNKYKPELRIQS